MFEGYQGKTKSSLGLYRLDAMVAEEGTNELSITGFSSKGEVKDDDDTKGQAVDRKKS